MSKFTKNFLAMFMFIVTIIGGFFTVSSKAEAANYGPWLSVSGYSGCQVRAVTDYSSYSSTATTVDAYLESNGSCPQMNYTQFNVGDGYGIISKENYSGYFSNRTPTKYFYLSNFDSRNWNPVTASVEAQITVGGTTRAFPSVFIKYYQ